MTYHVIDCVINTGNADIDLPSRGWVIEEFEHTLPEPRYNFVEIPGRNGAVNLTRATTQSSKATLSQREISIIASFTANSFTIAKTELNYLLNAIHGMSGWLHAPDGNEYNNLEFAIKEYSYIDANNCTVRVTIECIGD